MTERLERGNSLRSSVKTKEEAERTAEEKGEEELDLISDPIALANSGILLTNKKNEGRVIFSLRELPLHSEWRTAAGHSISRISRRDVLVCDNRGRPHTIDVPNEDPLTVLYLPDHVLQTIWLFLAPPDYVTFVPKDIGSSRLVCRAWARMIGRMIRYKPNHGIKFTVPCRFDRKQYPHDSSDDEDDSDCLASEGYDSATMCPISILVRLSKHRSRVPPKGILKLEGASDSSRAKKRVRFRDFSDDDDDESDEDRGTRETVRRKLTEGGDLSKRFLISFFGWSKRATFEMSDDESGDGERKAQIQDPHWDNAGSGQTEDVYREHIFENQARNLNRLKELEMRLEEMMRSKSRARVHPSVDGSAQDQELNQNTNDIEESGSLESDPTRISSPPSSRATANPLQDVWAESPVYLPPSTAQDVDPTDEKTESGSAQKRRRRDSLVNILSSVSVARKRLLAR